MNYEDESTGIAAADASVHHMREDEVPAKKPEFPGWGVVIVGGLYFLVLFGGLAAAVVSGIKNSGHGGDVLGLLITALVVAVIVHYAAQGHVMSARMRCEFCGTPVAVPDDWPVDWAVCKPCRDWRPDDDRREAQR